MFSEHADQLLYLNRLDSIRHRLPGLVSSSSASVISSFGVASAVRVLPKDFLLQTHVSGTLTCFFSLEHEDHFTSTSTSEYKFHAPSIAPPHIQDL